MKKLTELLNGIDYKVLLGSEDVEISGIVNDSRKVKAGSLFLCIRGAVADGHKYAAEVAKKGAKVLVVEEPVELPDPEKDSITVLQVPDTRIAMARLACAWYGHPSRKMKMIGVTGQHDAGVADSAGIPREDG